MIPNKVIINGKVEETQRLCPKCNYLLHFGTKDKRVCLFWCIACDYVGEWQPYEVYQSNKLQLKTGEK